MDVADDDAGARVVLGQVDLAQERPAGQHSVEMRAVSALQQHGAAGLGCQFTGLELGDELEFVRRKIAQRMQAAQRTFFAGDPSASRCRRFGANR